MKYELFRLNQSFKIFILRGSDILKYALIYCKDFKGIVKISEMRDLRARTFWDVSCFSRKLESFLKKPH